MRDDRATEPAGGDALRTDERRALGLLADGLWLGVATGADGRRRAWIQLSRYSGDAIPVGYDVVARLRDVGYLRQGRRTVAAGDRFRLSPAGRALVAADRRVEEAPLATGLAPVGVPPATPTRILVVDDDEAIRAVLTGILCDEGYLVETAADGAEALAAVARERPSAVLLDMHMPVLDGWGFVAGLRQRGIRVPIAVMTAARDVRVTCDEVAGDACLAKPFVLDAVVDTVARVCVT